MGRRVSTAAIIKENIEGRSIDQISVSLKIPVSDVVKAVSDPRFKRDLLDYRLMRGLQQFEAIGNLKGYVHAYAKALKEAVEKDPDFFKKRIENPKTEIHKELKGMMDVIRMASELSDKELKKTLREAEDGEDPGLSAAAKRLKERRTARKQQQRAMLEVQSHVVPSSENEVAYEPNYGDVVGPERAVGEAGRDPDAGAAVHPDGGDPAEPVPVRGAGLDDPGEPPHVNAYLLEDE